MILQKILVAQSPWHMLVGCALLNLTSRKQVDKVWPELFVELTCPEEVIEMDTAEGFSQGLYIRELLEPLGLVNRRYLTLVRLSQTYLEELERAGTVEEMDLGNVYGCGEYANDSWDIFVLGKRPDPSAVSDKKLKAWLEEQSGS